MGTAKFKHSWRKMEAAAETELDGGKWSVAHAPLRVTRYSPSQVSQV